MIYFYHTAQGKAVLNKGDKLVNLGKFKTEQQALDACKIHFAKACQSMANLGKPIPQCFFM